MKEKAVEAYLRKGVIALGGKCIKFVSPSHAGVTDRIVMMPGGKVYFVELKTDIGKLTDLQMAFGNLCVRLECEHSTLYGVEDVKIFLEMLKKEQNAILAASISE